MNFPKRRPYHWLFVVVLSAGVSACQQGAEPESTEGAAQTGASDVAEVAANRGVFGQESCAANARVGVPTDAAFALYYDESGNLLQSAPAEVLAGTKDNLMCPATAPGGLDPGICTPKCPKVIGGRTYCIPCPPG
jgi:hypothetical protein